MTSVLGNPLGATDTTGLDYASRGGVHANITGCNGGGNYGGTDDPTGGGGGGVSIDGGSTVAIGTFGSGIPAGGQSGLYSTTITETTWVQGGGLTSPQNTETTWFSPGASANINYYPQASSWYCQV